jgi:pilus assembly protein Flp/PilA
VEDGNCAMPPWETNQMFNELKRLLRDESAVTAVEYSLIASLIAVASIIALGTVGTNISATFNTVANKL